MSHNCIHLITLNVRGIRNTEKRQIIFKWLNNQHADIVLLQETYLDEKIEIHIKKSWNGPIISSFGSLHSRGVSILFKNELNVNIENHHSTIDGRKILVYVQIGENKYSIVNIYAPTIESLKEPFYRKTKRWIKKTRKV